MTSDLVVVADSDAPRAARIAEACAARGIACRLLPNGAAALEAALTDGPAVVVAQLELPLIGGDQLAAILDANPRTHGTGILFLADRAADAEREGIEGSVIAPPVEPEAVARCIQALLAQREARRPAEEAEAEGETGVEGQLSQLPLADLLQLFHAGRRTGRVEVVRRDARSRREIGRVELRGGDVIHASVHPVEGEKALFRLLGWDRGTFSFQPGAVMRQPTIHSPTRALLREGLRQLEEWERRKVELPPRDAHVTLKIERSSLPNVIHPLTQEVLLVLELYSRVWDVVDHCSHPDYQVLRTLHTLVERGMVELRRHSPSAIGIGGGGGLFTPGHVARLRDWLEGARPRGGAPRDAKVVVVSSSPHTTSDFAQILARLPGAVLDDRLVAGLLSADEIAPLARLTVDGELSIEFVHAPPAARFAPVWPMAGYGALACLVVLGGPLGDAVATVQEAAAALSRLPRARLFHVLILGKGESVDRDGLRENLSLLDETSLFLVPQESGPKASSLMRTMLGRVLP